MSHGHLWCRSMNTQEYIARVIELFKSGKATEGHYREMARAVAVASEDHDTVPMIDSSVGVDDEEEA